MQWALSATVPSFKICTKIELVIFLFFAWQDVSQEDIPIMLVGNKCDLRQHGSNCIPTSYGEKLAMVITNKHLLILLYLWGYFNDHITEPLAHLLHIYTELLTLFNENVSNLQLVAWCQVMTNSKQEWIIKDWLIHVLPNRHTTLCSVKLAPKMVPTSLRLCCTWPGEMLQLFQLV